MPLGKEMGIGSGHVVLDGDAAPTAATPHNMVNFGPLAAETVSLVWGTPPNFNCFRVFAGLLHGM